MMNRGPYSSNHRGHHDEAARFLYQSHAAVQSSKGGSGNKNRDTTWYTSIKILRTGPMKDVPKLAVLSIVQTYISIVAVNKNLMELSLPRGKVQLVYTIDPTIKLFEFLCLVVAPSQLKKRYLESPDLLLFILEPPPAGCRNCQSSANTRKSFEICRGLVREWNLDGPTLLVQTSP